MKFGDRRRQMREWQKLYALIRNTLAPFGEDDCFGKRDYWVLDENWGFKGQKVLITNLRMLHPDVVRTLKGLLKDFPDWHILLTVAVRGKELSWPEMGVRLTASGVEDELDRSYLPPEFQSYRY